MNPISLVPLADATTPGQAEATPAMGFGELIARFILDGGQVRGDGDELAGDASAEAQPKNETDSGQPAVAEAAGNGLAGTAGLLTLVSVSNTSQTAEPEATVEALPGPPAVESIAAGPATHLPSVDQMDAPQVSFETPPDGPAQGPAPTAVITPAGAQPTPAPPAVADRAGEAMPDKSIPDLPDAAARSAVAGTGSVVGQDKRAAHNPHVFAAGEGSDLSFTTPPDLATATSTPPATPAAAAAPADTPAPVPTIDTPPPSAHGAEAVEPTEGEPLQPRVATGPAPAEPSEPSPAGLAGDGPAVDAIATQPFGVRTEGARAVDRTAEVPPSLVRRVEQAVQMIEHAPPPRRITIEADELNGLRLTVSLRPDGIAVTSQTADGSTLDAIEQALRARGFDLSDSGRRRDPRHDVYERDTSRPQPGGAPASRSRSEQGIRL